MSKQKSITPISSIDSLNSLLQRNSLQYLLESELPSAKAYLKFTGPFSGGAVVWNACIQTIDEYSRDHEIAKDPKQFIDIHTEGDAYFVEIGLNVPIIDKGTVERTILMIRNYKRLHLGRHEYGARSKTL